MKRFKEWQRTIILLCFIAILIGLIVWSRRLPDASLTNGL
jgi:hypothetical protein